MDEFLGFRIVSLPGVPEDRFIALDTSVGEDQTAAVIATILPQGDVRIDGMLTGREAKEAFGRAMIGLRPEAPVHDS